jgi:hypothetical protein
VRLARSARSVRDGKLEVLRFQTTRQERNQNGLVENSWPGDVAGISRCPATGMNSSSQAALQRTRQIGCGRQRSASDELDIPHAPPRISHPLYRFPLCESRIPESRIPNVHRSRWQETSTILGSRIRENSGSFVHFPKSGDFGYEAIFGALSEVWRLQLRSNLWCTFRSLATSATKQFGTAECHHLVTVPTTQPQGLITFID